MTVLWCNYPAAAAALAASSSEAIARTVKRRLCKVSTGKEVNSGPRWHRYESFGLAAIVNEMQRPLTNLAAAVLNIYWERRTGQVEEPPQHQLETLVLDEQ